MNMKGPISLLLLVALGHVDALAPSCKARGLMGQCLGVESCQGTRTAGLCSGPAHIQCCTSDPTGGSRGAMTLRGRRGGGRMMRGGGMGMGHRGGMGMGRRGGGMGMSHRGGMGMGHRGGGVVVVPHGGRRGIRMGRRRMGAPMRFSQGTVKDHRDHGLNGRGFGAPPPKVDFDGPAPRDPITPIGEGIIASEKARYQPVALEIADVIEKEGPDFLPLLVRLTWHAMAHFNPSHFPAGGSNGGCMRTVPELALPENEGVDVAVNALRPVGDKNPWISIADLYMLAGNTALEWMGTPSIPFRPGRFDYSSPQETNIECVRDSKRLAQPHINNDPFPHDETHNHFVAVFTTLGFSLNNDPDALHKAVALMGGHSVGGMHKHISNQQGLWTPGKRFVFGNGYFKNLARDGWGPSKAVGGPGRHVNLQYEMDGITMLPVDLVMREDRRLFAIVEEFADDDDMFKKFFVEAWVQLQENGVNFP